MNDLAVWVEEEQEANGLPITAVTRLKHAALWAAVKKLGSQSALAKHLGMSPAELGAWVNLNACPPRQATNKRWTEERLIDVEEKLLALTGMGFDELFPDSLRNNLAFLNSPKKFERTARVKSHALEMYAIATRERFERLGTTVVDEKEQLRNAIEKAMQGLTKRERSVLEARFGLNGNEPRTLDECGVLFRVTRERVRQIECKAIRKLHPHWKHNGLELFAPPDTEET